MEVLLFLMAAMEKDKVSTTSKSLSSCDQVSESPWIEDSHRVKGVALQESLPPQIGRRGMFARGWREVYDLPDGADNSAVAAASVYKKVIATVGGCCSAVALADSGGILSLFFFQPQQL